MKKIIVLTLWSMLVPAQVSAEEKKEAPKASQLAINWTVHVSKDNRQAFEAALKAHMAFRVEDGDPRNWQVYEPVTGDDLNYYVVRYCCTTYEGMDEYAEWYNKSDSIKDFFENVDGYVDSYKHQWFKQDRKNSNWIDNDGYKFFGVVSINVKPNKWDTFGKALKKLSQIGIENEWPHSWAWSYPVDGDGGVSLVFPFENFADMETPDETFYQFIYKHSKKKKADKLFADYRNGIASSNYRVYAHNKKLSMPKKE